LSTVVKLGVCEYYGTVGNTEMCCRKVSSYDHSDSWV